MTMEMTEALGAIAEAITPAPAKVPEGKVVVAVELSRDEASSGRYMTAITHGWAPTGLAVALDRGHVIAANALFGRWHGGVPVVSPCHKAACRNCGKLVPEPLAVWEAKDIARRSGVREDLDGLKAKEILARFGTCSCGGKWGEDRSAEKAELASFAQKVLRAVEAGGQVPAFLPPKAFTVHSAAEAVDLGQDWAWLAQAMRENGKSAIPFDENNRGDALLFNPGFWLGYVDVEKVAELGLFFRVEACHGGARHEGGRFNPAGINGL